MTLPNPRIERAKQLVFNECTIEGLSREAIEVGADWAEDQLVNRNQSIARAVKGGIEIAKGEQKRIEDADRRLLREMVS